ncbi:MAG TPA: YtxH domain-containing protein [Armatimonadota bacterium]|jgi:gas vesicle protein
MANKSGNFWIGMLVGAAAGAVTALLTAPKKGAEMREDIVHGAQDVGRKAGDAWCGVVEKTEDIVDDAREKVMQAGQRSKEMAGSARGRIQKAVSAGMEAAAHKKEEMQSEWREEKEKRSRAA